MTTRKIEDVYPLSPLQEGMLFHSLYEPESGVYVEQVSCDLDGELDADALERAWRRVVERHPVLRTSFVWKRQAKPLQVVHPRVDLPFSRLDWSDRTAGEQRAGFEEILAADKARGFELSRPPLLRITLLRLGAQSHRVLWTSHHLLLDGWSLPLLLNEVFAAYHAFVAGREPGVHPSRPFGEYIAWLQRQDLAEAEAFWRRELRGFTNPATLAGEPRPRREGDPAEAGAGHLEQSLTLSRRETAALLTLAQRTRLTMNVLVQGGWALLLSRHGMDDVVFGITVSGRGVDFPGIQTMVGLFINTLPLRAHVAPAAPLLSWLRGLQGRQLEMHRFEHSPLPQIQRWSEVPRGTPLFESVLAFENYPSTGLPGSGEGGLRLRDVTFRGRTNYTLAVTAVPGEELQLRIAHDTARYDAVAVRRMLLHLRALLEGMAAAHPEAVLADLSLLTAPERHQLVAEWNDTASVYPSAPVHELFEAQVDRSPGTIAVCFDDGELTYRELDRRANQVAHRLLALGVGPGTPVGLTAERSAAMVAALLGVLKAGGTYVPLAPSHPAERLAFLIGDAGLRVVLTGDPTVPLPADPSILLVPLEEAWSGLSTEWDERPRVPVPDSSLAYVIYTSGSTGLPKGTSISHRAICRLVHETDYVPFGPAERLGQQASLSFDAATFEIFGALLHGATLVGISREEALSPWRLGNRLRETGVTVLIVTTALFNQIVREGPEALLPLRHLLFGGEASDPGAVRDFLGHGFAGRLLHMYGPTECTTFSHWNPVREVAAGISTVPIGRPIANTTSYVLDRDFHLVPAGVPGELFLGGDGLAQGYSGRRELTAEKFVPDPLGEPGGRLYRTGDLVRQLADGPIEFLGRLDNQVKIRGFRIETGEIETVLGEHPGVSRSAVVVQGEGVDRRLAAFVVPRPGADLEAGALRTHLRGRLPEYMVPSAFVLTESLPLTVQGKVDRRALAAGLDPIAAAEPALPLSGIEETLASVWADVLRVEKVDRHDDFFELGGDSILSIQIVARANRAGVRITPRQLFDHPTIAALAVAAAGQAPSLQEQGAVTGAVPLTPIQHGFFEREDIDLHHFNQDLLLRLRQPLEPAAAERAVAALLVHHDALRLRFHREENGWRQWHAGPEEPVSFLCVDLSALGAAAGRALTAAADQVQASLDLTHGPLLRAVWLVLPEREARLHLVIHHLAIDGVSWRILVEDLESACRQIRSGEAVTLPLKTTSFRRWAEKLAEHARILPPEPGWWLRQAEIPVAPLPLDRPGGEALESSSRSVAVALDPDETRALLQEVPRAFHTQINDVLLAALVRAVAGPGGRLRIALEGHGREEILEGLDLSRTVGWFTSQFPVVLETGSADDPGEILSEVREQLREIPERGIGHGLLRFLRGDEELAGRLRRMPEPEVGFNYLGQLDQALPEDALFALAGEPSGAAVSGRMRRAHVLAVNARVLGGRLEADWSYSASLHDRATVDRWAEAFLANLRAWIARASHILAGRRAGAGLTPADFPLAGLPARELARVLETEAEIEDVYALSPLQEGLLFHSLYAPGLGVYLEQLACTVTGDLDAATVEAAWQRVVERNPVLRTSFRGLDLRHPVQVVHPRAAVTLERDDWRDLPRGEQERRLDALARADRERGLDVSDPPLMRWALIATGPREHRFFWTYHHVLFDGWSFAALAEEFLGCYAALRAGVEPQLPQRPPYRDYIAWLREQDMARTEAYWRRALAGWSTPTPLAVDREPDGSVGGAGTVEARLGPAATAALQARARRHRLTLNVLVQGAWALLLGRYSGQPDVVFGSVVAGRPAGLPGVESMIGLFINTLPVRVEVARDLPLVPWLQRLQERNLELRQHEHSPLVKIQQWSEVPRGLPLFESILAFESYPLETTLPRAGRGFDIGFEIGEVRTWSQASDPLSVAAFPGDDLHLRIDYATVRLDAATVGRLLEHLRNLLHGMAFAEVAADEPRLGDLSPLAAAERHQLLYERGTAVLDVWGDPAPAGVPGTIRRAGEEPTGELGRYRPDGAIEVLGRTDPRTARLERRLRALAAARPDPAEEVPGAPRAPINPIVERLSAIWSEVLLLDRVGPRDDFFALGGHSLLVTQLASRARAAFGVELPLASLFERPTIEALAAEITLRLAEEKGLAAVPLLPVPRPADLPLSFAQERLWFVDQLEPENPLYNVAAAVRMTGPLRFGALAASLSEIVRRHESLRTTFAPRSGRAVQVIAAPRSVDQPVVDLAALAEGAREAELGRLVDEEARRPFDLAAGPLARMTLVRLGDEEHAALWTMHHIISDGWSMGVFLRELAALYEAFAAGRPSPLAELPLQYADFALWQRRWLSGAVLERQLAYWRGQLAGAPATVELPVDHPRSSRRSLRRAVERIQLSRDVVADLHAFALGEDATLFMVLLAAFQAVIARQTRAEDLVIGSPIANRNRIEIEGLIGFFVNTLVLRTDLAGNPGFRELLSRVRKTALGAYAHQDLPFEKLVAQLAPSRRQGSTPLFQILFALQNAPAGPLALPGLELAPLESAAASSEFEVALSAVEEDGGLVLSLRYGCDLYDGARIRRLLSQLATLIEAAVRQPELRLSALPLLSPVERRQLAAEWRDGGAPIGAEIWSALPGTAGIRFFRGATPEPAPGLPLGIYLLDDQGEPVPPGVPGEVHVAGAGLDTGHLERPDLTAERFVPDPFSSVPGRRMVRGGALARRRHDGTLDLLGLEVPAAGGDEPRPEAAGGAFAAPRTPTEELVAGLWAELLGRDRVGCDEDFFELGGHSLLATQAVSRLREAFGAEIPLRLLFESPVVEELAAGIDEILRAESGPPLPPLERASRERPLPLSFAQQRLWIIDRIDPGLPAYNMPFPVRLTGALDVAALLASLREIVRRHEVLRTRFAETAEGPVQVVLPAGELAVPRVDLRALPWSRRPEETERLAAVEAWRRFDLARGPLLRAVLLDLGTGPEGEREHALLLTLHHIAADAGSLDVFLREMAVLSAAFAAGRPSPLPEPLLQYGDYAVWQRTWRVGEVLESQLAYWREQLAGAPVLELPTDRPRPAAPSLRGAHVPLDLDGPLVRDLRTLGQRRGATLFMVVLAVFQTLLHRFAGQEDVVVGSPISNRDRRETEDLIGFFVNMLPLRARLAAGLPFAGLLARVRETALGGYAHRELPFERLVEAVAPERDPSRNPLFQAVAQVLRAPEVPAGGALAVRPLALREEMSPFDLGLTALEREDGLRGTLQHRADLFDRTTALRLARHLEALLAGAAADPERPIGELPLWTEAEAHQLAVEWNDAGLAVPPLRVHERFEALARLAPAALAVVDGGEHLTREALNKRADRLAAHLRQRGAGPEVLVAVFCERSAVLLITMLAVAKAGAVFVPLDPTHPRERIAGLLADCGAPLLVTRRSLLERLPQAIAAEVVDIEDGALLTGAGPLPPPVRVEAESLAYVIYTSGSTGRPNGVAISHANLSNLAAWLADLYGMEDGDRVSQVMSPAFDASVVEIWPALTTGASLHIAAEETRLSIPRLFDWLREEGVTVLHASTALTDAALAQGLPGDLPLRLFCVGGDRLRRRPEAAPPYTLQNQYGPTEITALAIVGPVEPGRQTPPSIGRPVGNATVRLLDRHLRPVPLGAVGEITVGGAGVGRGYLHRPDLTAERFLPDASGPPGSRVYRTGDLARHLTDGRLDFLGRLDHQVKVRGFRVEPREIETVLGQHSGVAAAVVVAFEDAAAGHRLVAYVVPRGPEPADLRGFLRARLPEFEVPAAFVLLDALPLDPNGKVDRRALPEPAAGASLPGEAAPPRTPVEELLVAVWREVLGVERIGIHDSFFDLGGHSLLATRLASRLRATFGVEVPLRPLFDSPTVAALAAEVERLLHAGSGEPAPPIVPVPREGDLPLSFAQQRLWVLDQIAPGSTAYNMPLAVRLAGALDAAALESSLGEIVRRHEALRTTFPARRGGPVQEIAPFAGFALPRIDLGALSADRAGDEAARLARAEALRPFDLLRGPLLRPALLRLGDEEHVLLLGLHHIVADGWSMSVLVREISALYPAFRAGLPAPLPELPVQYADYAVWQRRRLSGEALEGELAWWRQTLAGAPLLELPTDRPHAALPRPTAATRPVWIPREAAAALLALGRGEGVTPFMALLAAWNVLLGRYTGQRDLAVGSPIANRRQLEIEGLIGFFVNTLVLRTAFPADAGAREILRRVREVALGAFTHQDVPFDLLVDRLHGRRSFQRTPFFQVLFALQNASPGAVELPGLTLSSLPLETGEAKFELTLSLAETEDGLHGALEYRSDLYDPATIERLLVHFQAVLAAMAEDPEGAVSALPLLSAAERHQLLREWNDTAAGSPCDLGIHRLFERRAALAPEALAVTFGSERLTYGELDALTNRLARRLRRLGAGPEVPVGVCLERSAGLIVALLAVLKAGGFYVPLDPAHPAERLAAMVEDARPAVLLGEQRTVRVLPPGRARVLLLDGDRSAIEAEAAGSLPAGPGDAGPDHLAYVMYTSGSTGRPKGVEVTHRNIARLVLETDYVRLESDDRVAQASNASFDAATFEIWGALLHGARVVGIASEVILEPRDLAAFLRDEGITTLFLTTALFLQLARETPEAFAPLRHLLSGGETIDPAALRRVLRHGAPRRLLHTYGPTETTTFASWQRVEHVPEGALIVPIGRPIANTRIGVLDAGLRPVPLGVHGELYIGGDGVARGYLRRPELTAERFVPDPDGADPGARLYRTGDLVRRRADGAIEFLGRIDRQVKIRGVRIEPGEIEAALAAHPALREAAVLVREDLPGDRRLVAYAVAAAGAPEPSPADLQAFLRRTLLEHMVPSAFVFLAALPLTPNGKLDRSALPAPGAGDRSRQASHVPPRTGLEERIAGVWSEVLGVEPIGVHDNFFDLGGHSLAVVETVSRLRTALGRELSAVDMFQHPTVAALAAALEPAASRSEAAGLEQSGERGASRRELLLRRRGTLLRGQTAGDSGKEDRQ